MAINKLPKLYSTDFRLPNKKPIGDVEIDWGNPLTDNLVALVLFNEGAGSAHDLVTGKELTSYNTPSWSVESKGRVLNFDGVNQAISLPLNLSYTDSVCVAVGCEWLSYANNDDLMIEFKNPSFVGGGLLIDPNSGAPHSGAFSIAANRTLTTSAGFARPSGGYHDYLFGFSPVSSGLSAYIDGLPQSLSYGGTTSGTGNFANSQLNIASRAGSNLFGNGNYSYVMVFDKDVSNQLAASSLSSNPYQILKPKSEPVYFTADTGGTTITVPATLGTISYAGQSTTVSITGSIDATATLGTIAYASSNTTVDISGSVDVIATLGTISYTSNNTTVSVSGAVDVIATLGAIDYSSNNVTVDVTGSVDVLATLGTITYSSNDAVISLQGVVSVPATIGTISYSSNDTAVSLAGLIDVNATLGTISYTSDNTVVTVAAGQTFGVVGAGFADDLYGSIFKPDSITVTFRG